MESWVEAIDVAGPIVHFRAKWVFASDGAVLRSDSALRFRDLPEIRAGLARHGPQVVDVRDAPDRPGREFVVLARRPG